MPILRRAKVEVREKAARPVVNEESDGAAPTGVMQIVDSQRFDTIDHGAQLGAVDLEAKSMPATEGDVGCPFVASRKLFPGYREVKIRMRHVLDRPVDARRRRLRQVEPPVGHTQVDRFVCLEIPVDVE